MGALQSTDTGDRTLRVGSQQSAVSSDKTIRSDVSQGNEVVPSGDFILKGRVYRGIKCLSDSSGEAQVFLVSGDEGEMVLKVYYPNFVVKKELMRIVQNFDMEMVVRLADYGKTYVDGRNRDYELMEYLRGGSLADYDLDGDFTQFRRIALQAAAALAYCHKYNIIHKDIKPSNFFFRDTDHREVVLGDFGISSIMESDERLHRTTQARTPVYAAPEMYNDVIDGEVEITSAADFYSLGITLMTLWLGENPMSQNERVMMRRKNEGRLPRINELPNRVKMIVQGLTAVNPQSRWGYNEVERWFLGEDVKVDISSPILKYRSFVFDPEQNLVADNVHELIPLLLDNERLAINYLYSGRIASWLEQCGNVKLSAAVKDIVVNRYPVDQHAGLLAAVYAMEPSYPYRDIRGNQCDDVHSVAVSLLSYQDEYALALRNANDPLFLYIESHTLCNVSRLRSYFSADSTIEPRIAILRLSYEIDKEIPFLAKYPSSTLADIVHSFGYEQCTDDEWLSLSDGRLLSWMYSHEDNMACEALRIMTHGQTPSRSLGYKVLYNINREAAYDLREADSPEKVAAILAQQLVEWQEVDSATFEQQVADYSDADGRFHYFAQLHGWYEQISQADSCFNLNSEENRNRLGAYDLHTAAYRFCRMLGTTPVYQLSDGTILHDGIGEGVGVNRKLLQSALRKGALSQWMAVFYHEDPFGEFDEPYSYERKLEEWVYALGAIDATQKYYKRFVGAKEETARKYKEVRGRLRRAKAAERAWRGVFYGLCGAWLLLLLFFGISNRPYLLSHMMWAFVLPVGGVSALIVGLRAYFRGYGFVLSCLWGLLGMATSLVPSQLMKYVGWYHPDLFLLTVVAVTAVYMLVCHLTDFHGDPKTDSRLIDEVLEDDIKSTLLEPLYYTFKQKSFKYKSSKFGMLDDVTNQIRDISGESVMHYVLWSIMALLVLMEMVLFCPSLLNLDVPGHDSIHMAPNSVVEQLQNNGE